MRIRLGVALILAVPVPFACVYDWSGPLAAADGGADGSTDGTLDDAFNEDAKAESAPMDAGDGMCSRASACADGSYCAYADRACGKKLLLGTCTPTERCLGASKATYFCTCNQVPASSACEQNTSGSDLNGLGDCDAAGVLAKDKFIACGYRYCLAGTAYCRVTGGLTYDCVEGPCPTTDCKCLERMNAPACTCFENDAGALVVCTPP